MYGRMDLSHFDTSRSEALSLDRRNFVGGSPFLFAAVLERFLALYCAINSFSEFVLETVQDGGVVHRWKPRAGEQPIL